MVVLLVLFRVAQFRCRPRAGRGRWLRGNPPQTFICSPSTPALPSSSSMRRAAVPTKWPCFSVLSVVLAERSLQNGLQYFESVASAFRQAPRFRSRQSGEAGLKSSSHITIK
ncbi:hypothetical protein F2P79_004300, partial [Pimephales promelas]